MWKRRVKKAILKLNIQKIKIMASGPIILRQIDGETKETVTEFIFLGSKITADDYCSHEIKRFLLVGRKAMTNLDSLLKSRDITFLTKIHLVKPMVFPVVEYGCESWTSLSADELMLSTMLLQKTFESPLDHKDIKPVYPKRNKYWIFIGRTAAEVEAPILCPPDAKSWPLGKVHDFWKDWSGSRGWQSTRWLDGSLTEHEFEQAPGDGGGQESLTCCSSWGFRVGHEWVIEQRRSFQ